MNVQQLQRAFTDPKQPEPSTSNARPAVVGHAAPLRAKIAQFESKGGVPVPRRTLDSFGMSAPVVDTSKQRRAELYGNRMKPVWVPTVPKKDSPAQRPRLFDDRLRGGDRERDKGWKRPKVTVGEEPAPDKSNLETRQLLSPPESPQDERDARTASAPPAEVLEPALELIDETVEEAVLASSPEPIVLLEELGPPIELQPATIVDEPADVDDVPAIEELHPEQPDVVAQLDEPPDNLPLPSSDKPQPLSSKDGMPSYRTLPRAPQLPPSPPPSPPRTRTKRPLHGHCHAPSSGSDDADAITDVPVLAPARPPPPTASSSAIIHSRMREKTPRPRNKQLPPTPAMTPAMATEDLAALLSDAAALERRLMTGDLPAETIRRLSHMALNRPPPPPASGNTSDAMVLMPLRRVAGFVEDAAGSEPAHHKSPKLALGLPLPLPLPNFHLKRLGRKHKEETVDNDDSAWFLPEPGSLKWRILQTTRHTGTSSRVGGRF
ncbi:hypothetical protein MKEN_00912600 [Mycena kentingensis (nom. inval.)]|nr:hypothetical protein MKEN_00912600 [Mycena kentingensis (nom. inval.)]